jgi:hypothetical protein
MWLKPEFQDGFRLRQKVIITGLPVDPSQYLTFKKSLKGLNNLGHRPKIRIDIDLSSLKG